MARGHHRTAAVNGPDALDWFEAARDLEDEFGCSVVLTVAPAALPRQGRVVVSALVEGTKDIEMAVEGTHYPNSRMAGFWPTAYLVLHKLRVTLANRAYAPARAKR